MIEVNHEKTGDKFQLETYFKARELCLSVVDLISKKVTAGMNEADGQQLIKEAFNDAGITKFWHPSKFRIGSDTTKSFRELPTPELQLAAGDLFFVDVGPIFEDHESDFGETFIFPPSMANNPTAEKVLLRDASEKIWQETASLWKAGQISGMELYQRADQQARSLGYRLNPLMAGHRLGDFPHSLFSKEKLAALATKPAVNLWVLEIHIVSDHLRCGSFFEDILL